MMTKLTEGKVRHQDKSKLDIPKPSGPPLAPTLKDGVNCSCKKELTRLRKRLAGAEKVIHATETMQTSKTCTVREFRQMNFDIDKSLKEYRNKYGAAMTEYPKELSCNQCRELIREVEKLRADNRAIIEEREWISTITGIDERNEDWEGITTTLKEVHDATILPPKGQIDE